ncbi:hypothetical protein SOHN41_01482 [Shewanella sp. HN-41]|nr:hypothetical protein SOHN41_01482 [Shewanella sp. HN-41]
MPTKDMWLRRSGHFAKTGYIAPSGNSDYPWGNYQWLFLG